MRGKTLTIIFALLAALSFTSCVGEEYASEDTPSGNFEALWKLMDEHYCFFEYKEKEIGVDWDEVHSRYARQITSYMSNRQLFEVLCNMLAELKDGHVNLNAVYDMGRNWSFKEDYPENYNDSIARSYLGTDYIISSGLKYKILDDNIGYVRCESFSDAIGEGNMANMASDLAGCNGLIVDVRGNSGGSLTEAHRLASMFINKKRLIGYTSHKTGKGRGDFSSPEAVYLEPSEGLRWQKKTVVLTNRGCYSATNEFVSCMKSFDGVTILGDSTGGGSGMPFTSEIPHGWSVRYSAVVHYDPDMNHIEFGVAPDVKVAMRQADIDRKRDTLIEAARSYLNGGAE